MYIYTCAYISYYWTTTEHYRLKTIGMEIKASDGFKRSLIYLSNNLTSCIQACNGAGGSQLCTSVSQIANQRGHYVRNTSLAKKNICNTNSSSCIEFS